jgi:site-specific DNA-methyltransferase (adenine-specific)
VSEKIVIGNAELYCGDCLDILPTLGKVDAVVTSPPYGEMRDYGGSFIKKPEQIFPMLDVSDGGPIVWNTNDQHIDGGESGESFRQALAGIENGWKLHDTMIWCKGGAAFPDSNRYWQAFEYIFIFVNGKIRAFNPIRDRKNRYPNSSKFGAERQKDGTTKKPKTERFTSDVGARLNYWEIPPEMSNKIRTGHPAQMSQRLCGDLVFSFTSNDYVVLDPFMGSGTTGVACMNLGRKFIGIELEPKYFGIACERIRMAQAQGRLFA